MKSLRLAHFACMLGTLATLGWMAPAPAAADNVGTDAAIGAAVGTIIGQLLFDSNRRQYYYVHERRRNYVSDEQAWQYRRIHWREAEYNRDRNGYVEYANQRDWERHHEWERHRNWERQHDQVMTENHRWVGGEEHHDYGRDRAIGRDHDWANDHSRDRDRAIGRDHERDNDHDRGGDHSNDRWDRR